MKSSNKIIEEPYLLSFDAVSTVLVTGCFDILHVGHIKLLEYASRIANDEFSVLVGLNSDRSIRKLKGAGRPINSFKDRALVMSAISYVDFVFEIDSLRVDRAIRWLRPHVWIKGGDYTLKTLDRGEVKAANDVGAKIKIFKTVRGYSTTNLLKRK